MKIEKQAKPIKRLDECYVVVDPKDPGDYGAVYIGGVERSDEDTLALCEQIKSQIKRHVDGAGHVRVHTQYVTECSECGLRFEIDEGDPDYTVCCGRLVDKEGTQ